MFLHRRGAAMLVAVIALAVITAISLGLCMTGNSTLSTSASYADTVGAKTAAESGLQYGMHLLRHLRLPASSDSDSLLADLQIPLSEQVDGEVTSTMTMRSSCPARRSPVARSMSVFGSSRRSTTNAGVRSCPLAGPMEPRDRSR
jgi:Tfp pilus assembly protein PilX